MSTRIQDFLADSIAKSAVDLEAALLRLTEEIRTTNAGGDSRTAIDQIAECAILNGTTASILRNGAFPADFDFAAYEKLKQDLASDWNRLKAAFDESNAAVVAAVRTFPDESLENEVAMPWGPMKMTQNMAYPYWNMSYHEGQINFIASMHGLLP